MTAQASIDFETRSAVDLRKAGSQRYAADPTTDIICMAFALDAGNVSLWRRGDPFPVELRRHLAAGGHLRAWNAPFEMAHWPIMVRKYGAPELTADRWHCTLAEASAMALPRKLEHCAKVLHTPVQKNEDGKRLIQHFSKPRKGKKKWGEDPDILYFNEGPDEELEKFYEYCRDDVRTEMAIAARINRLLPAEREHWLRVVRKNARGIHLDMALVAACQSIVDEGTRRANLEIDQITDGAVNRVSQRDRLKAFLNNEFESDIDKLDKHALKELLSRGDLLPDERRLLELRAEVARSSTAKLKSMAACVMKDDRARGLLIYHGASTGRETGALIQPQNFARGDDVPKAEQFIPQVMEGNYDLIDLVYPPIAVVSALLRPCITATPGRELIAGDYSAIEARVLNILAGQTDVVEMFRKMDEVAKVDEKAAKEFEPYTQNGARFYKIDWRDVQKATHRQHGKVIELGCGFGCGADKLREMSRLVYGLEMTEEESLASVRFYRSTHQHVESWWYELNDAAIKAVKNPGLVVDVTGGLKFVLRGGWLLLKLPTGRLLYYASPRVHKRLMPWSTKDHEVWRDAVECWAVDATKRWSRYDLYGGLLAENVVQAVSRDVMYDGEAQIEKAGYDPVLSVHDEIVAEVDVGFGSIEEFSSLMVPQWCRDAGWPIAVEVWRGERYRK